MENNDFLKNEAAFALFDEKNKLIAWNHAFLETFQFDFLRPFESWAKLARRYGIADDSSLFFGVVLEKNKEDEDKTLAQIRTTDQRIFWAVAERSLSGHVLTQYFEKQNDFKGSITQQKLEETVQRRTLQLEDALLRMRRTLRSNTRIANALQRNEARLRLINDTIPIQIGYVDKNRIYQYANKGYSDWFGNPPGFATGRSIPEVIGQAVYEQVKTQVDRVLMGEQVSYEYSFEKDGQTHYANSTLVPEFGSEGETLGFFVFSYNISEQKRLQAALMQAQKMEAIGQLTGGLAHDFNNLLTVIIGNLAALVDHHPNESYLKEYIEPALRSARRGVQLIRRLLTFSRQQPQSSEIVDIPKLINDCEQLIKRSLPESIELSTQIPNEPIYAAIDPSQLESAIVNFALNARDAMPHGGKLKLVVAQLLADDKNPQNLKAGNYVAITIQDNGQGMSQEVLKKAFEPFFTTKRFGLGSGLGLAMAHNFATSVGGNLVLESELGRGTTVQLFIPEHLEAPAEKTPEILPASTRQPAPVLLVEDEKSVRIVVRQQLMDLGYPVIEAENGKQALEILKHVSNISTVLSDIIMPGGISGNMLAAQIHTQYPNIHVILMSGYHHEIANPNQVPLLHKPFDKKDLAQMLNDFQKNQKIQ